MTPEKAKNIYWEVMPLPKSAKPLGEYDSLGKHGCLIELANGGNAGTIRSVNLKGDNYEIPFTISSSH